MEAITDAKRLALDEGVVDKESELFFSGGKDDWHSGHRPKGARASLVGSDFAVERCTKDDLAFLMVLEQILHEWMKEVLELWV